MAVGEHLPVGQLEGIEPLPTGSVVTSSGRVSAATELRPEPGSTPFSTAQLARLDEALTMASRDTGLRFNIYLGDLGSDPSGAAHRLLARLGAAAADSVLVAVSPEQRQIEVVTGHEAARRLPDRGAKLGVMTMVASFKKGDLFGGLRNGLRMLADQATRRAR